MDLSELERLENPTKTMKLSEAIRIGARLRPQCKHQMWHKGASCALGAAYEARYGLPANPDSNDAHVKALGVMYDWGASVGLNSMFVIVSRNDRGETREQVADWLESQGY